MLGTHSPPQIDCYTPVATPGVSPGARALDAQRSVRYDALLELVDLLQRKRSIDELAKRGLIKAVVRHSGQRVYTRVRFFLSLFDLASSLLFVDW